MGTLAAAPGEFSTATRAKTVQRPKDSSLSSLVLTYPLVAVLIFLAARGAPSFLFATDTNGEAPGGGGTVKQVLVLAAFGTMLALMLPVCRRVWRFVQQYPFPFLLPLWATLTLFWSVSPVRSLAAGVQILILTLFACYVMVRFTPRQQMQLFVFTGLMATLASFVVVAVLPRAGIDYKNKTIGIEGIYPQKNICAVITVELLTAGLCYTFTGKNGPLKRIVFLGLLTLLILVTAARTGWILGILTVAFIILLKGLHRLRPLERFATTWFLPAVAVLLGYLVYSYSTEILQFLGKDPSLSGRTGVWKIVFLSIVKRPWTGFGYGAFWSGDNTEPHRLGLLIGDPTLSNAENGVLELWLDAGLIGVLILFYMLFRTCRNAFACFRSNTPNYAIWYMSILFINMLALVDGSKFLLWTSIEWLMYIMADIGLAAEAKRVRALRTSQV